MNGSLGNLAYKLAGFCPQQYSDWKSWMMATLHKITVIWYLHSLHGRTHTHTKKHTCRMSSVEPAWFLLLALTTSVPHCKEKSQLTAKMVSATERCNDLEERCEVLMAKKMHGYLWFDGRFGVFGWRDLTLKTCWKMLNLQMHIVADWNS